MQELLIATNTTQTFILHFDFKNTNIHVKADNTVELSYINKLESGEEYGYADTQEHSTERRSGEP